MFTKMFDDTKLNVMELYSKYLKNKDIVNYVNNINLHTKNELEFLRKNFNNINNEEEFLKNYVSNFVSKVSMLIVSEYGDLILEKRKNNLTSLNVVVINDKDVKNDVYVSKNKLTLNLYYVKGNDIYEKIINIKGVLVYELFHVVINLYNSKVYDVSVHLEKEIISVNHMIGYILNEGFISKIVSEFCTKFKIYNVLNITNIANMRIVNYILNRNKNVVNMVFKDTCEEILNVLPKEEILTYLKEEAKCVALKIKKIVLDDIKDVVVKSKEEEIIVPDSDNTCDLESLIKYCDSKNIVIVDYFNKDKDLLKIPFIDISYNPKTLNYICCILSNLHDRGYAFMYNKSLDGKSFFKVEDQKKGLDSRLFLDLNISLRKYDSKVNYFEILPADLKKFFELSVAVERDDFIEANGDSKYFRLSFLFNNGKYQYELLTHDSYYTKLALKLGFNINENNFIPKLELIVDNRQEGNEVLSLLINKIKEYVTWA